MSHLPGRDALEAAQKKPRRHKYGVSAPAERTVDGILFASKAEMRHWQELELLKRAGEVLFVLRQVPFGLPGNARYVCDFAVFWKDGRVTFEDIKGAITPMYRLKKRQVEALYPVKIEEVRARR